MPLHDWTDRTRRWYGMRHIWICDIARELIAKLPPGDRALLDVTFVGEFETEEKDIVIRVERNGRVVAAVELLPPHTPEWQAARDRAAVRHLDDLRNGTFRLVIDIHDEPAVVGHRVGPVSESYDGLVAWRVPLTIGELLPAVPVALTDGESVALDLERTYMQAAHDNYIE